MQNILAKERIITYSNYITDYSNYITDYSNYITDYSKPTLRDLLAFNFLKY